MSNLICPPFSSLITPFTPFSVFSLNFTPDPTPSQPRQHQILLWNRGPDGSEYIIHPHDHTFLNISLWQSCIIIVDSVSSCHSSAPFLVVFPHSPSGLKKLFPWQCGLPFRLSEAVDCSITVNRWLANHHSHLVPPPMKRITTRNYWLKLCCTKQTSTECIVLCLGNEIKQAVTILMRVVMRLNGS